MKSLKMNLKPTLLLTAAIIEISFIVILGALSIETGRYCSNQITHAIPTTSHTTNHHHDPLEPIVKFIQTGK